MSHWPSDNLNREYVLAARLREHGAEIFAGDTDVAIRRERFRAAILRGPGGSTIMGHKAGKPIRYCDAFAAIFGEPLEPKR